MRIASFARAGLALGLVAALGACTTVSHTAELAESRAIYAYNAGAPVASFKVVGVVNRWAPLGNDALVVYTSRDEAYLLALDGYCHSLEWSPKVTLTNAGRVVQAGHDKVLLGRNRRYGCRIDTIQPIDTVAVEGVRAKLRSGESVILERPDLRAARELREKTLGVAQ